MNKKRNTHTQRKHSWIQRVLRALFAFSRDCSATFHLSVWKRSASPARQREYGDRWLSCLPMSINHCWHIAANVCYFMLLLVDPGLNHTVLATKSNLRQFHTLLHWTFSNLQHLPAEFESVLLSGWFPQLWSPYFLCVAVTLDLRVCTLWRRHTRACLFLSLQRCEPHLSKLTLVTLHLSTLHLHWSHDESHTHIHIYFN